MIMSLHNQSQTHSREIILQSIRSYLAESALREVVTAQADPPQLPATGSSLAVDAVPSENGHGDNAHHSPVEMFREHLEAIGGHCIVVESEVEAARALNHILAELQATLLPARRIALSDAPLLARLTREMEVKVDELNVAPSAVELFDYDVGLTTAQIAIAETGTLVLESDSEHHRLVSLLPPVHIAVVNARNICLTIGDALKLIQRREGANMSRTVTFITGPSRTADIELTLTIGVHGPKELYVIVCT